MNNNNAGTPMSWKRIALTALCIVLAVVLIAMVGMTIYVEYIFSLRQDLDEETMAPSDAEEVLRTEPTETISPTYTGEVIDPTDVTIPQETAPPVVVTDYTVSFLLVGQDRREGQGRMRSDAMILCTINKETKTLTITSFLRDTYLYIPGYFNQRLNVAYMVGGFNTLNETLKYNFGVSADHMIEVDFGGFEDIIELVGGVNISLTAAEAEHLNAQNETWNLTRGNNRLNGAQALAYSRIRAIGSDIGRTQRQRTVVMALVDQMRNLSLTELNDLATSVMPMIATDMELSDITGYLIELFPLLPELTMETLQIPASGTFTDTYVGSMAVLMPDLERNQQILRDYLGED